MAIKSVLAQATAALANRRAVVLNRSLRGCDDIMVWDWARGQIERACPGLSITERRIAPEVMEVELQPAVAGVQEVLQLTFPAAATSDLVFPLFARRKELMKHHGFLIPKSTQLRALHLVMGSAVSMDGCLTRAFDLLDDAAVAYRQSLLARAETAVDVRLLEAALRDLAKAIELAFKRCTQLHAFSTPSAADQSLRRTIRSFEEKLTCLGGPPRAATLRPVFVDSFAKFNLAQGADTPKVTSEVHGMSGSHYPK